MSLTVDDSDLDLLDSDTDAPASASKESNSSTLSNFSKKAKFSLQLWKPPAKAQHCPKALAYLNKNPKQGDMFEYLQLEKGEQKSSNWVGTCLACGSVRTGGITTLAEHFTRRVCRLTNVPETERQGLSDYLSKLAKARLNATGRDTLSASAMRAPVPDQRFMTNSATMGSYLASVETRRSVLLEEMARFLLSCNLPASLGEHPGLRRLLDVSSGRKIDHPVAEVLKRDALTKKMDAMAKVSNEKSFEEWKDAAVRRGGTLMVDGWTAARLIGTIGVSLCSLNVTYILPLLVTSTTRSRAQDYVEKLENVVPWPLLCFVCTDGAANMVAFGELLEERNVLSVLCAAHGFSLTVHYIGKVFEERSSMFSKAAGIIAFFNRSNQRLAFLRKEYGSDISFVKFCKTRMAYQTLSLMRLVRLRQAAQKAMISIKAQKISEDEEQIDKFSKLAQVDASLNDDKLFRDIDLFCRVTLPVLLAMREVDRGTPMAGFIYWLHYHVDVQVRLITEKLVEADPSFRRLAEQIRSAVVTVWEKRHRPVLSFAYLTNPLLHSDLSKEANIFDLDENFRDDIDTVLMTLLRKRYTQEKKSDGLAYSLDEIMAKVVQAKSELSEYLTHSGLNELQRYEAKHSLAAMFWTDSAAANKYKELSWCASRVHAMPVVTSKLERFFSHIGNVQTDRRANLDPQRASLYAAAHQQLVEAKKETSPVDLQRLLVELVKRCEAIETEEQALDFERTDGFSDLEEWIEGIRKARIELLYKSQESESRAGPAEEEDDAIDILTELDAQVDAAIENKRQSQRNRKAPRRLNL